jgi:hypothetical protein
MIPPIRNIVSNIAAMAFGLVVATGAAELCLRLLPVNTGLRSVAVSEHQPIFHFQPDRDFVYSKGWRLDMVNRGHVNNAGFVNNVDYDADAAHPRLAIIGDSYVEALMVPYAETMQGRLSAAIGKQGQVFSFAASGAPLSQYLVWANHARAMWGADALVITVVGNDFDESLAAVRVGPGFHHYVESPESGLMLRRFDYTPNPLGRLGVHSALVRYLLFNLNVAQLWESAVIRWAQSGIAHAADLPAFAGNTAATTANGRLETSRRAVDAFFRDLPGYAGLPPTRVLFVVDGFRVPTDPAGEALNAQTYFGQMRRYFMEQAQARGYGVIDGDESFMPYLSAHPQARMDYPTDGHWNGLAHGLMAERIAAAPMFRELFAVPH